MYIQLCWFVQIPLGPWKYTHTVFCFDWKASLHIVYTFVNRIREKAAGVCSLWPYYCWSGFGSQGSRSIRGQNSPQTSHREVQLVSFCGDGSDYNWLTLGLSRSKAISQRSEFIVDPRVHHMTWPVSVEVNSSNVFCFYRPLILSVIKRDPTFLHKQAHCDRRGKKFGLKGRNIGPEPGSDWGSICFDRSGRETERERE